MACLFLILLCTSLLSLYVIWTYITKREELKLCPLKLTKETQPLQEQFLELRSASYKTYKKPSIDSRKTHQSQICCMVQSSKVFRYSLKNPNNYNSETKRMKILNSYLKEIELLPDGIITTITKRPINLRNLIEKIEYLFAERIYTFEITLKIISPKDLLIYGDSLFAELILTSLLGRSIYCVPKKGKILILIQKGAEGIEIIIQDNGYSLNEKREKLLKQSFSLFMTDTIFQKLCQDNNCIYQSLKFGKHLNVTVITIPNVQAVNPKSNVIQLYR